MLRPESAASTFEQNIQKLNLFYQHKKFAHANQDHPLSFNEDTSYLAVTILRLLAILRVDYSLLLLSRLCCLSPFSKTQAFRTLIVLILKRFELPAKQKS